VCQYPETGGGSGGDGGVGLEGVVEDELEVGKLEHAVHRKKEIARQQQLEADRKRFRVFLLGSSFIIQIWTNCDLQDATGRRRILARICRISYITQPYSWCMKRPKGLHPGEESYSRIEQICGNPPRAILLTSRKSKALPKNHWVKLRNRSTIPALHG
jgi:hypothetical protein